MPNLQYSPVHRPVAPAGMKWAPLSVSGSSPVERWGHTCTTVRLPWNSPSAKEYLLIFGGGGPGKVFDDFYLLDTETRKWTKPDCTGDLPGDRAGHSAVLTDQNRLLVFGGSSGPGRLLNDLHSLDLDTMEWRRVETKGTPPSRRVGHTATIAGNKMVVFGGCEESDVWCDNSAYVLDTSTMEWSSSHPAPRGEAPSPRSAHTATMVSRNRMIVYGGIDGKQRLDDLHELNLDTWSWSQPATSGTTPPGRSSHTATLVGNHLVVSGGWCMNEDGDRCVDDIYLLDLMKMQWRMSSTTNFFPPRPRANHTACIAGNSLWVYGGRDGLKQVDGKQACFKDVHVLDIQSVLGVEDIRDEIHMIMGLGHRNNMMSAPYMAMNSRNVFPTPPSQTPSPSHSEENADDAHKAPRKRHRTTPEQLEILERAFLADHMPNEQTRYQIASQIGMSPRSVQIWFQNKRAKVKRAEREVGVKTDGKSSARSTPNTTPHGSPRSSPTPESKDNLVGVGKMMKPISGQYTSRSLKRKPSNGDNTKMYKPLPVKRNKYEDKTLHPPAEAEEAAIFSLMTLANSAPASISVQ